MAAKWLRWVWLVAGLSCGVGLAGQAGAEAVDWTVRQIAQAEGAVPQYPVASNASSEGITLRVVGISNFDDYAGLLNYLGRVAAIKTANPIQVTNDEVTLQLKMQGSAEQLVSQLALENRLTPAVAAEGAVSQPLQYRWSAPRG